MRKGVNKAKFIKHVSKRDLFFAWCHHGGRHQEWTSNICGIWVGFAESSSYICVLEDIHFLTSSVLKSTMAAFLMPRPLLYMLKIFTSIHVACLKIYMYATPSVLKWAMAALLTPRPLFYIAESCSFTFLLCVCVERANSH